eukprot:205269-Chlamydomonas_euryale.AAC.2
MATQSLCTSRSQTLASQSTSSKTLCRAATCAAHCPTWRRSWCQIPTRCECARGCVRAGGRSAGTLPWWRWPWWCCPTRSKTCVKAADRA